MPRTTLERAALLCLLLSALMLLALVLANTSRAEGAPRRVSWHALDRLVETDRTLPRGILRRHRRYERASGRCYDRPWNDGRGQVCGAHQVLVWDSTSRDGRRLGRVVSTRVGAVAAAAMLLDESRAWCAARPGKCKCPWARLNWRDQWRLCAALAVPES